MKAAAGRAENLLAAALRAGSVMPMRRRSSRPVAIAAALAALAGGLFVPIAASGETTKEREEKCTAEKDLYGLIASYGTGTSLRPESGAAVAQHSAVTFSGESEVTPTFEVFSSQQKAEEAGSQPDVDSGTGQGIAGTPTYVFTSTHATALVRTLYWRASISLTLEHCSGTQTFYTTEYGRKPLQLVVEPASQLPEAPPKTEPAPPACTTPSPGKRTSWSAATVTAPCGLRVGITAAKTLRVRRPGVAYAIVCTASCTGTTSMRATLVRRHGRRSHLALLDMRSRKISIAATSGGTTAISDRFGAKTLRRVRALVKGGAQIELVVRVAVKDSAGREAQTSRTILLRR